CDLFERATQTVFGEGPRSARLMLVGETPGDREDTAGKPFVGPAGALLDGSLEAAGLDRKTVYVTNAVKHFRYEERGKRRMPKLHRSEAITPDLIGADAGAEIRRRLARRRDVTYAISLARSPSPFPTPSSDPWPDSCPRD